MKRKLTEQEILFVKDTCEFMKDSDIAFEINRIRRDLGEPERVNTDNVTMTRRKLGLKKRLWGHGFEKRDGDE